MIVSSILKNSREIKIMNMRMIVMGVLCAVMAFAADVTGKWTAETTTQRGTQTQTFDFKADGSKLTGTVTGGRGGPTEITEGKISGDKISFKISRTMQERSFVQMFEGTVAGDEIKLSAKVEGMDTPAREMTAKRAK